MEVRKTESVQSTRKVTEVSDARFAFLLELESAHEAVVPRKDVENLVNFLASVGLTYGVHFTVKMVRVSAPPVLDWSWWGCFTTGRRFTVRKLQGRAGYNRTRVEVTSDDIFVTRHARED